MWAIIAIIDIHHPYEQSLYTTHRLDYVMLFSILF